MNIMSTTVQDEGNACFDMAAAAPGLKSVSGRHIFVICNERSDWMTNQRFCFRMTVSANALRHEINDANLFYLNYFLK